MLFMLKKQIPKNFKRILKATDNSQSNIIKNSKPGKGRLSAPSGILDKTNYSFKTRFEEGVQGTNPEELLAAAHAGCFTMR